MSLADLHVHSTFSDGKLSVAELVDWYGAAGVKTLGITDHWCDTVSPLGWAAYALERTLTRNSMSAYLDTLDSEARRAKSRYGMTLITGVEFTWNTFSNHRSAHIVVLAKNPSEFRELSPHLGIEVLLKEVRKRDMLSIAAHPLSTGKFEAQTYHLWDNRDRYAEKIDVWECSTWNRFFPEIAEAGLPKIANSDLHSKRQALAWRSLLELGNSHSIADVFECVRAQALQTIQFELPHESKNSLAVLTGCSNAAASA
jgi:predicted metal-dependent phosphoesterase TrpH